MRVGETGRCDHQILEEGTHDEKAENVGTRLSDREREGWSWVPLTTGGGGGGENSRTATGAAAECLSLRIRKLRAFH